MLGISEYDGSTLLWIREFLSSRNQRVLVEGQSLHTAPVCSEVPQGSILEPLVFLLFINDLPDYVKSCNARLFAGILGSTKGLIHRYHSTVICRVVSRVESYQMPLRSQAE
jgi:hypothetical protein